MKIEYKPTPNVYDFWAPPVGIELHTTLGSLESAVDWLRMTPEERLRRFGQETYSSAMVVFGRNGEIVELATVKEATWHAGAVSGASERAKALIPRTLLGGIKNPNRYMLGYEFASGYDIDKDGVLESWEKLYTPAQIKASVWYTLNRVEPQMLELWGVDRKFNGDSTLTHRDTNAGKPNLDLQRAMFVAELSKQREAGSVTLPTPVVEMQIIGNKYEVTGENINIKKI